MAERVALLAGATGLVGGHVLELLASDSRWSRIVVLARRSIETTGAKVQTEIVDFEALAAAPEQALPSIDRIDDVFACLGTTIKTAGSEERFRRVDHDYTVAVAKLGHAKGARRFALVSSVGASERGSFYLRVKAETERDVRAVGWDTLAIARPSFLLGARGESRPGERAGIAIASLLSPLMLGGARAYRPIEARAVAAALVRTAGDGEPGERILTHPHFALT